ncbi:uncharacterized protein [Nicotiana sylvestris]|uniref:uncharacterized protein n=1 Tax=Nicotiana sylvestris TaxID=4096 RepID=UPI00388CBE17
MAKEAESGISLQTAVDIARRIENVCSQERGRVFDKSPRHFGGFNGASCGGRVVPRDSLSASMHVSTTVGDYFVVDPIYRSCMFTIGSLEASIDLLLLDMVDFDVTLGINWLLPYHAIWDCHAKMVTLDMSDLPRLKLRGTLEHSTIRVISYVKDRHMVEKGCLAYLAYICDSSAEVPSMDSVPVVSEFPKVFLVDLSGMSPDRDIDFCIDLALGAQSISILPYCLALPELKGIEGAVARFS